MNKSKNQHKLAPVVRSGHRTIRATYLNNFAVLLSDDIPSLDEHRLDYLEKRVFVVYWLRWFQERRRTRKRAPLTILAFLLNRSDTEQTGITFCKRFAEPLARMRWSGLSPMRR